MLKLLYKIETYLIYTFIVIFPILVLPVSTNPFVLTKLYVLVYGLSLILLTRIIRILISGKLEMQVGTFDFSVFLIAIAYLASAYLRTPNKMEAFLLPGNASFVIGGVILYFLINQLRKEDKGKLGFFAAISGAAYSVISLSAFANAFKVIPQLPALYQIKSFTPEGGYLPSAVFLLVTLTLAITYIVFSKNNTEKILSAVSGVLIFAGLTLSIISILPGQPNSPRFPSFQNSWSIAVDSLKISPIFGIGPGNYLTAFNRFRPIDYNATDLWAVKYSTASNQYLTLLTETGMLGLAGIILLLYSLYKVLKHNFTNFSTNPEKKEKLANSISVLFIAVVMLFLPVTSLITVVLFVLLAMITSTKLVSLNLATQQPSEDQAFLSSKNIASRFPAIIIVAPIVIGMSLLLVRSTKAFSAEYKFLKAIEALTRNDAQTTNSLLVSAIQTNPRVDRYRSTYARVALIFTNSIIQKYANDPKAQVSEADRTTITQLIQLSIQEAKASVALNPGRAGNWETLGQVYRSIMPLAKGADAFSAQSYRQAVALDPYNPGLRITLGGIFYAQGALDQAVEIFKTAVSVKPDLANAHYNLAFAYRDAKQTDNAISEMTTTLSLITDKSSKDYEAARKALEDLQAKKKAEAPQGNELTPPQEGEESVLKPPIELPEGSQPPSGEENIQETELTTTPTPGNSVTTPTPQVTTKP